MMDLPEPSQSFSALPHPRALAFLGDAVFELFLREWAVSQGMSHSRDLHAFTSLRANAKAQVAILHALLPQLTEAEQEIIRQGRNLGVGSNRRAGQADHRMASALEALLGALYLQNRPRLDELLVLAQQLPLPTEHNTAHNPEGP